jgi:hypothetical protein
MSLDELIEEHASAAEPDQRAANSHPAEAIHATPDTLAPPHATSTLHPHKRF